jgi:hypothetical protein
MLWWPVFRTFALGPALTLLTLGGTAIAQTDPAPTESPSSAVATPPVEATVEPPRATRVPHPIFAALTAGGELGGNYAVDTKLAVLGNPFRSGISLGGSIFFAPYTNLNTLRCPPPCNLAPLLFRWMAELRVGTAYGANSRGLGWLGISAGVTYLVEPNLPPGPSAAIAAGGDIRVSPSLWLETSLTLTGADMIGPDSPFAGTYVTLGFQLGIRLDLAR